MKICGLKIDVSFRSSTSVGTDFTAEVGSATINVALGRELREKAILRGADSMALPSRMASRARASR
jgi:hypothetical protein